MKKIISVVLLFCLAAALLLPAALADGSLELQYDLNIDGSNDYKAQSGEIITVSFTLRRLDAEEGYSLFGLQNEIIYDQDFFEYVDDSATAAFYSADALFQTRTTGKHIVKATMMGGSYEAEEVFCTFQLKVVATSGSGKVESTESIAYDEDNRRLDLSLQDLTVTIEGGGPGPGPGPGTGPVTPTEPTSDIIVLPIDSNLGATGEGKRNPDGTIDIIVRDRSGNPVPSIPGGVWVKIPHVDGQVVVQLNDAGEIIDLVEKSLVEDGTAYTLLPGSAKIRIIDNAKPFRDVSEADWFNEFVIFTSSHELFIGVEKDLFAPRTNMSRAMMVTVLWRLEDRPMADSVSTFTDMERNSWYDAAVDWAAENGITLGYSDEEFGPRDDVTREQMATLLYRYMKDIGFDVSARADFSDYEDGAEVSDWADEAMHWAVGSGLIIGRSETELAPRDTASRAEVATMFKRLVTMMVKR